MAEKKRLYDACPICGKPHPEGSRVDRVYCSKRCTAVARRSREKVAEAVEQINFTLEGAALLAKLKDVLPVTGRQVEAFILDHGRDCTEAAVKLVLTAYSEAQRSV